MAAVCVFCSSSTRIDPRHVDLAAQVGRELAARGHSLVSGGGALSMMGAVAQAARAGGARTVGVIPTGLLGKEVGDRDADELVVVDGMRERKGEMDARADAFLVLPGGLGTLEELLEVWVARSLGMHDKPVVVLDPDGVLDPLLELVDALAAQGFVRAPARRAAVFVRSVEEALREVEQGVAAPTRFSPLAEEVAETQP